MEEKNNYLAKLRARAEKNLDKKIVKLRRNSAGDLEKVLHELSVHQIELEMQNEEIINSQVELEKSRAKYADLYDFAPVGYLTIDKRGIILEANLTGCQMLGIERSNLINKPFHLYVDRENKDDFYLHRLAALTPGLKPTCEITIVRKDKTKFQARLDSIPVVDDDDNVNSCRTAITDISEQKHAQQQVINLAKFPAEDPFPVLRISAEGKIIYNNKPAESLLAEWQCEIWQKAPLQWRKIVSDSLRTKACFIREVNCGGTIFLFTVAPVPEGGYVNLYGTDITKKKQAEEQLEQSEKKYRRLFDTMSEGFALGEIICNKKGKPCDYRFLEVNPAFEELTGLKVKNVVGKTIKELIPDIEQYWIDTYGEVALTGNSKSFENFTKALGKYYDVFAYRPEPGQFAAVFVDITERKKAEEALWKSQSLLRAVMENTDDPVFVKDKDSRILMCNPALGRIVGKPISEIIGKLDSEYYEDNAIGDALHKNDLLVMESAEVQTLEEIAKTTDGYRTFISNKAPYRNESGEIIGIIGISHDITELKKAEAALRESEQRLSLAASGTRIGMYEWNVATGEAIWTEQIARHLGLRSTTTTTTTTTTISQCYHYRDWAQCVHPEDLPRAEAELQRCMAERAPFETEYRAVWPDGTVHWIADRGVFHYESDGRCTRLLGISMDITERKKAEEALRQRTEELQTILDTTPVAIFMAHDPECRKITGNPAAQELVQLPPNANISKSAPAGERPTQWQEMRDGVPIKPDELPLQRAVHGEEIRDYEMDMAFEDGTVKSVVGNATPIRDENNKPRGGIAVLIDITERKKAEEELRRSNDELNRFNKYAVGREMRMVELKKEINSLCEAMGEPARYKVDFDSESNNYEKKQTAIT